MWFYVLGLAISVGCNLLGYQIDVKAALLVYLICIVLASAETRKSQS